MLSILIPTYDYTCYQLVHDLHEQAEQLGVPYEIIVAEDGSRSQVNIIANHKIEELSHCRHIIRKENVGRAAIRNVLIRIAKGELLLMMDADGRVVREDFLAKYVEAGKEHDVVCGGIKTPEVCHDPTRMLRWKYEMDYEQKHGCISEQFRSFCFLITRRVAATVSFDERYRRYGYEDVQYGKDLAAAGFEVYGIDNPLENKDIETNEVFLQKTEEALRVAHQFRDDIGEHVTVAHTYFIYKRWAWGIRWFFRLFKPLLRKNLLSKNPSLFWFSVYKLGYYSTL
ncbi:MAG: glycosyltransferase family 2 protein [Bacteroidaceae bacterium]|nr:glycosyltransferase family 2 protein [Bacteroidaceae bacterium]